MRSTDAALLVISLLIAWSLYRAHKNASFVFNVFDLIMENGRVSRLACAFMLTLVVTSWIMVRLTLDAKMTEGYLVCYGGMWVAPIIAKLFTPAQPSESITTSSTTTATKTGESNGPHT